MSGLALTPKPSVPWSEQLPAMVAAREAWQREFGPLLKERDEQMKREREQVRDLLARGLAAINASVDDRALVSRKTGFAL